ncbi:restriction endonuclease subunit S [Blastomonas sp. UPD001]|uniref:restriction endonuclease subunit S n=1 Tax=Blastomonas sp. UPD001 TaxID=2217673 RepID=UPI000E34519C|nr:restriction endonuclease subunit S [Blastomonas sp. UPD001]
MSEWVEKPLDKLVSFKKGRKVETSDLQLDGFLPYLGASSLTGGEDGFALPSGGISCVASDALMLWDGERSGLVGPGKSGVISSTVMRLRPEAEMTGRYLVHCLRDRFEWIQARRTGTGVPHVPKDLGRILELRFPEAELEQNTICNILDALDTQIEATEGLIAKQERVRAGLMQDLFTRGVDEHGQLRPPRHQAPHLYHQTELGWLPVGWKLSRLKDHSPLSGSHLKTGPFGSALKIEHWVDQGWPVITIGSLGEGILDRSELLYVSDETAKRLWAYQLIPGDVVFSRVADVGRSVVIGQENNGWIMSSNLMRIRLDWKNIRATYLHLQLSFDAVLRNQIRRSINSGGRDVANAAILNALKFAWPLTDEQDRICEIAQTLETETEKRKAALLKLRLQKSGLMQDLLTGKVSVAPLLEQVAA